MKRILLVGLVVAGLTVVGFSVPVFAHGPEGTGTVNTNQDTREAMYEACWNGDREAMAEAAEAVHQDNFSYMPCYGGGYYPSDEGGQAPANYWGGMGNHMGGGMMSW
jgi:hypothetical protein